jgi:hypothetical protein
MSGLNRDDIIRMAREVAGVTYPAGMAEVKIGMSEEHLERFAALVAAAEREACAKVCESAGPGAGPIYCAFAIRARGKDAA